MIASIKSTIADVTKEMKKVSWPTKQQLSESTVVVIKTCAILTLFVWLIDIAMAFVNKTIF
ncbi:MAG: preprotein translocase subunit SecE [bacterium]